MTMEEHVLEILKLIKADKVRQGKVPVHIVKKELSDAINQAVDKLKSDGRIKTGETINSTWIDPIE